MDLPRVWITAGSNEKLWGDAGTYKTIPYEALPPIDGLDRFGWLERATGAQYGMTFEHQENPPIDAFVRGVHQALLHREHDLVRREQGEALRARARALREGGAGSGRARGARRELTKRGPS